jgi:endonuclease/exonuclease/phosphatase family metal-dependent hydrolase
MRRVRGLSFLFSCVIALAIPGIGVPPGAQAAEAHAGRISGKSVTVMTRNIYVGGDITKPITQTVGKTGTDALLALGHANHALRATVDATSFSVRGALLAKEMARARPDLIGLQEVALWRSGPIELAETRGVPNATTVDYDFLSILLADLRRRGAAYRVASAQQETDVEAPSFLGDPTKGTASDAKDIRLTVSDVVLVRQHSQVRVLGHGGAQYRNRIALDIDLGQGRLPLTIVRGYAWADVRVGHQRFRFVTTHLESQSSDLALAQAGELLAALAVGPARTILVCDCNSDPLNDTVRSTDHVPHSAAYRLITGLGGFTDEWLKQRHPTGPGFTSGLSELVNDPTPAGFRKRIDMVFGRVTDGSTITVKRGYVTGDQVTDRDRRTGLWPSDHAGVVLRLRLYTGPRT